MPLVIVSDEANLVRAALAANGHSKSGVITRFNKVAIDRRDPTRKSGHSLGAAATESVASDRPRGKQDRGRQCAA